MKINVFAKATAIAAASFAIGGGAIAQDREGWPTNFTIGTGSQGGTYFGYGSGWGGIVSEVTGRVWSGGSHRWPYAEHGVGPTGDLPFGMTTMGPAAESIAGNNPIAPGLPMTNACAMFPMYQTPFSITALATSGTESVADIPDGARIGFGPAGSTSDTYFPRMMEELGVNFERRNGGWSDLGGQLQDGLLDVIAFAAGVPVPAVSQLEVQTDVNIIEFTEEEQGKITAAFPVAEFDIAEDTYTTLDAPARSVSMWNFAIANCDLPESFIYAVVDAVMSDNERMVNTHKAARSTLPEFWDRNQVINWHPGAARWFEENAGADIPDSMVQGG